ncbi:MAG: hypothetical protein A2V66_04150 [Ignavibacteria bacterium RBG_13_36_8]|nr:MAG: hypothetical protein A2V66_04150 [Ignavibacteria bacterium RBG_13_36_8]
MKCDEVKSYLDEYFEGSLTDDVNQEIQEHLKECESCNNEYKLLTNFLLQAKYLKTGINTPKEILDGISDALIRLSTKAGEGEKAFSKRQLDEIKKAMRQELGKKDETSKPDRTVKKVRIKREIDRKTIIWLFVIIVICAGIYFYIDISKNNSPWSIKLISGLYRVNARIDNSMLLKVNNNLSTDPNSKVGITVPRVSRIELDQNSSITLLKAKDGDNRVKLNKGTLIVDSKVDRSGLTILTAVISVQEIGGRYSLTVDDVGNNRIEIFEDLVEVTLESKIIPLAANYICEIKKNGEVSVPYHKDAGLVLRQELKNFQYYNGGRSSLSAILSAATEFDALSLWYLLSLTSVYDRLAVYDKLYSFYPVPKGVTQDGIMRLDDLMLRLWWDEIEWQL